MERPNDELIPAIDRSISGQRDKSMFDQSPQLRISPPSLDKVLELDIEFVRPVVVSKYSKRRRRPPIEPIAMVRALIYKSLKGIPSCRKLAREIAANKTLAEKLGFAKKSPCHDSFSAFTIRLGTETFATIFKRFVDRIRELMPDLGRGVVAIDSTLVKAYARRRRMGPQTDPDARYLRYVQKDATEVRVFGFKLGIICDAQRDLPLNFVVAPATASDMTLLGGQTKSLLGDGFSPDILAADAGYDTKANTLLCFKFKIKPVIALNPRSSSEKTKRKMDWILPIQRDSTEWRRVYAMRVSIERVFSRLKEELGLLQLKLRGLQRVTVHFALCLIAMLAVCLVSTLDGRPELSRSLEPWRY